MFDQTAVMFHFSSKSVIIKKKNSKTCSFFACSAIAKERIAPRTVGTTDDSFVSQVGGGGEGDSQGESPHESARASPDLFLSVTRVWIFSFLVNLNGIATFYLYIAHVWI